MATFTQSEVEALADALADTDVGLTGSEIGHLLNICGMQDPQPVATKRRRLLAAFSESQNGRADRVAIVAFLRKSMKPERWLRERHRFEPLRERLNAALSFVGQQVDERGILRSVDRATTLSEAEARARSLRADLVGRGVHPDVLRFCRSELVGDDYFHAVLEAMKSVADKLRERTGLDEDGAPLVDRSLTGDPPMLAINELCGENQRKEQSGFANLVKGAFGMFRNTTAHVARIHWSMSKEDAEDLLSLVSLIHRRLDAATVVRRAR